VVAFTPRPFRPGRTRCRYNLERRLDKPITDGRALDERNVWEGESLFFVSSNRNSRVVTVRDGLGEIGDKFQSDVTLPDAEIRSGHLSHTCG